MTTIDQAVLVAAYGLELRPVALDVKAALQTDRARLPAAVFAVDAVPHAWLYPRVAAVVHHGGAGTDRVRALGVSPAPIPRRRLSIERLARALDVAVHDHSLRARCDPR